MSCGSTLRSTDWFRPAPESRNWPAIFGAPKGQSGYEAGGYLVFSDLNEIMKWAPGSSISVFRNRIFSGTAPAGVRVGTNGLTLDRQGRLVGVEHGNRRVSRFEMNGETTVLADRYSGKRLNSPNDLVIKKSGEA